MFFSRLYHRRGLSDLRELDLDGNPCAQSQGYRHRVIRACPRLHEIDGEEIAQLDRDLSTLFFEEQHGRTVWGVQRTSRKRPVTAPAITSRRKPCHVGGMLADVNEESMEVPEAKQLPKPESRPFVDSRLLKSDRLNNDPQVRRCELRLDLPSNGTVITSCFFFLYVNFFSPQITLSVGLLTISLYVYERMDRHIKVGEMEES